VKKIAVLIVILVLSLMLTLVACTSEEATTAPTPTTTDSPTPTATPKTETLKVGFLSSMSGPGVMYGVPLWQLAELQRDLINAAGGIKVGDTTYILELVLEDDKFAPEAGVAAVNKLVFQDNVSIILTGFTVAANAAAMPILMENEVVSLSLAGAIPLGPDTPWYFIVTDNDFFRMAAVARAVVMDKPEIERVVTILTDDEGGHLWAQDFRDTIVPQFTDWEIVEELSYTRGEKDYVSLLTRVLRENPEIIYLSGSSHGECGLILKQARELGYTGAMMFSGAMDESVLVPVSGAENAYDFYVPAYDWEITPAFTDLLDLYVAEYGEYNAVFPFACDAIPVLKQAIEQAGSIDPFEIREALETGTFDSLLGTGKFSGMNTFGIGHQFFRPLSVGRFDNGVLNVMYSIPVDELLQLAGEQ